ncbi:RING finger protein narya isoform X2 [Monomorium pharaonis]|uniref:RING finger protein narya isoform X2 n=1 Tax=Monomorium pharaonis TaxID=307658 RepID=UPI00063F1978|nr:RING finger protein narya isoform X2 [Monomorium pharaonis]
MQMNALICNKCFSPIYRGKRPYHITQCGHVFCQGCLQQVEKQCSQCQRVGSISLPLQEPLIPKLISYFQPFIETLETLMKVDSFRSNQLKITMQRFYELDKKYEVLKTHYWQERRNNKMLMEKHMILKNEKDKLEKKLLFSEQRRETSRSSFRMMETPPDSGISMNHASSTGYSVNSSMEYLKTPNITPIRSVDSRREHRSADGFRIPSRKPPRSVGFPNMMS